VETEEIVEIEPQAGTKKYGYKDLVLRLGGKILSEDDYERTIEGLQNYLEDMGVKHFDAEEVALPKNAAKAKKCGITNLLPPKGHWLRTAGNALFADLIRDELGEAVTMANHYRSSCYNLAVGGVKNSDHTRSQAMDLHFKNKRARERAQSFLCEDFWIGDYVYSPEYQSSKLGLAVGLGNAMIHVSLFSPLGERRYWFYEQYSYSANAGRCWKN